MTAMRGNPKTASALPDEFQSAVMALYTDEERANVSLPEVTLKLNAITRGELTEAEADGFFWEAFMRERRKGGSRRRRRHACCAWRKSTLALLMGSRTGRSRSCRRFACTMTSRRGVIRDCCVSTQIGRARRSRGLLAPTYCIYSGVLQGFDGIRGFRR